MCIAPSAGAATSCSPYSKRLIFFRPTTKSEFSFKQTRKRRTRILSRNGAAVTALLPPSAATAAAVVGACHIRPLRRLLRGGVRPRRRPWGGCCWPWGSGRRLERRSEVLQQRPVLGGAHAPLLLPLVLLSLLRRQRCRWCQRCCRRAGFPCCITSLPLRQQPCRRRAVRVGRNAVLRLLQAARSLRLCYRVPRRRQLPLACSEAESIN